jgi:hypothetical protein
MEPKLWYLSKTTLVSIAAIVVGAVSGIINLITGTEVFGVEEQTSIVFVVGGLIGLVLRFVTKEPITL